MGLVEDMLDYTSRLKEKAFLAAEGIRAEMMEELKKTSPVDTGLMKEGWKPYTKKYTTSRIYAVKNQTRGSIVHLVDKGHDHYSHGKRVGYLEGTEFATRVQEKGLLKLQAAIDTIVRK